MKRLKVSLRLLCAALALLGVTFLTGCAAEQDGTFTLHGRGSFLKLSAGSADEGTAFSVNLSFSDVSLLYPSNILYAQSNADSPDAAADYIVVSGRKSGDSVSLTAEIHQGWLNSTTKLPVSAINVASGFRLFLRLTANKTHPVLHATINDRTSQVALPANAAPAPRSDSTLPRFVTEVVYIGGLPTTVQSTAKSARELFALEHLASCVTVHSAGATHGSADEASSEASTGCNQCSVQSCSFNGGSCHGTDAAIKGCDCGGTGFNGPTCQNEVRPVSFNGNLCSSIHLKHGRQFSRRSTFMLRLREASSGTVLDTRHFRVFLSPEREMTLSVTGRGEVTTGPLAVATWHAVEVSLGERTATLTVNGEIVTVDYSADPVSHVGSTLTIGCQHIDNGTDELTGVCLRTVSSGGVLTSMTNILLDPTQLQSMYPGASVENHGTGQYVTCYPLQRGFSQLVQFTTPESRLDAAAFTGSSLFFSFRTTEQHGLLAHGHNRNWQIRITVECGKVRATYRSGSEAVTVQSEVLVSDDTFHELRFERLACRYGLTIDGRRELSSVSPTCIAGTEGNTGRIFLGGSRTGSANGFIGCMHNTLIDGEDVGLDILVDDTTAGVKQGCGNAETCAACKNSAICQTKTIGVSCDCSKTDGFAGETCSEQSIVATFTGEGVLDYSPQHLSESTCDTWDISFQIRPTRLNGTILQAQPQNNADGELQIHLKDGNLILYLGGMKETVFFVSVPLTLNSWNTITVSGQSKVGVWPSVRLTVGSMQYEQNVSRSTDIAFNLDRAMIRLGGAEAGHSPTPASLRYRGCMRNVYIQGKDFLRQLYDSYDVNYRDIVHFQVPFLSRSCENRLLDECVDGELLLTEPGSHVAFSPYAMLRRGQVTFNFTTNMQSGLILATRGQSDHFYLQLEGGEICSYIGIGSDNFRLCAGSELNDVSTHMVTFTRHHRRFTLTVDDSAEQTTALLPEHNIFSLDRRLLVGTAHSMCHSNDSFVRYADVDVPLVDGFAGCVRDLKINGLCSSTALDYRCTSGAPPEVPARYRNMADKQEGAIFNSCSQDFCDLRDVCLNGGFCYNAFTRHGCKCRGTGYLGRSCEEGAPAITFPCNHYALQTVSEDQQPIIEGRTKPVFAVVYRSQKQPATPVALASLIDFNHTLLLQLTQVGDRIRLETVLSPELGMYSVESGKIPSLADFEYHILHLTAIRAGAQDSKFRSPIIQLEIYSNKRDPVIEVLEIKYPVNSIVFSELRVGQIELGSFGAPKYQDKAFSNTTALCGHIREAVYNDVAIVRGVMERMPDVQTNALPMEEALEDTSIYIATEPAHKRIDRIRIFTVRLNFRAHGRQDSILFALRSPSHVLLVMLNNGAIAFEDYTMRSISRSDTSYNQHRVEGTLYDDGAEHHMVLRVNGTTGGIELVMDNVTVVAEGVITLRAPVPNGFDTAEIGGSSSEATTSGVQGGFTGCLDNLMLNTRFVNLRTAKAQRSPVPEKDFSKVCPSCLQRQVCLNRGRCTDGDEEKFTCDCQRTGYEGELCEKLPPPTGTSPTPEKPKTTTPIISITPDPEGGVKSSSSTPVWIIPVVIFLLFLLAILLILAIYFYLKYTRRHTGMFSLPEKIPDDTNSDEIIV